MRFIGLMVFLGFLMGLHQGMAPVYGQDLVLEKRYGPARSYIAVHTLSFLKNSEYFNSFVEGETIAGFQLQPLISYQPTPYFVTQLGVFIRRYWAEPRFVSSLVPTLRAAYQGGWGKFVFGTLPQEVVHRLIRPFYNSAQVLVASPPTGIAVYGGTKERLLRVWLDWRTLLNKAINQPEALVAGFSTEQPLVYWNALSITLPLQVVLYHLGGQGIRVKDFSIWMYALGLSIKWSLPRMYFLNRVVIDNYYVGDHYVKLVERPFKKGHGWLSQLSLYRKYICLRFSYWRGWGFSSENIGHPLYQSARMVDNQVMYYQKDRQLLCMHLSFTATMGSSLGLGIHVDPYYDLRNGLLEHEAGLYLMYNPYFELSSVKKYSSLKNDNY